MNQYTESVVMLCASEVRFWAEEQAREVYNSEHYYEMSEDLCHDLNGWCAKASAELWYRLKDFNIKAEIRLSSNEYNECHVFLVVEDHIVDITATQFRRFRDIPILILHEREADHEFHQTTNVFKTPNELVRHQKKTEWVSDQMAFNRRQMMSVAA